MKYLFGVLGAILLLIVAFVLIFNRGDSSNKTTTSSSASVSQLVDYADKNSNVTLTTQGRLVGDESRRGIRIVVSANERRIEILSGFDQNVISTQTYPNTDSAYQTFLSALGGLGFLRSQKTSVTDQRSVCPTGFHYNYDLNQDGSDVSSLWGVSCGKTGTFAGTGSTIRQLFQDQIPDYGNQVSGVQL